MFEPEWQQITGAAVASLLVTRKRHYYEQKEEDGRYV
jgi:hypothetical protein